MGPPVLSPTSNTVALLYRPADAGGVLDFQMLLVDLAAVTATPIGTTSRLGGPYAWLPDGSGIVLKRFLPAKSNEVEPTRICLLRLDGTLTDLRSGDSPLVLPHARTVLFEDEDGDWFTCDFTGRGVKRFRNGMKQWGTPAVSPDGTEMLWCRFSKIRFPQLHLFSSETTEGKLVTSVPGFVGHPAW